MSSSLFGNTTTSSLFGSPKPSESLFAASGKDAAAAAPKEEAGCSENPDGTAVEEEANVHFEPLVKLATVEVNTGEDNEQSLLQLRAKLYRMDKPSQEWKERGTGDVKFLKTTRPAKSAFSCDETRL
eukprot:gnl/Hemi2/20775_TR6875_c0_g2_i1.p2 gnl/Hemi2/20775_TR6875_c0_g2~~gnl/Hemi2/20775_TR6875_c0_g2_i1.p2  ORF type:complete len:127 (-),score=36.80 gnl/Hemi2/20775_TR6875_c0_g2_i1:233-613(-)